MLLLSSLFEFFAAHKFEIQRLLAVAEQRAAMRVIKAQKFERKVDHNLQNTCKN